MVADTSYPVSRWFGRVGLIVLWGLQGCVSETDTVRRVAQSLGAGAMTGPVIADSGDFRFSVVGDLHLADGDTHRWRRILQQATNQGSEFVVLLGDNVDTGERADFQALRDAADDLGWTDRLFSVVGNHDIYGQGWSHYLEVLGPSTYVFTAGNCRFIALDTADATVGGMQAQWLRQRLAEPWDGPVFLLSHYAPQVPGVWTYLRLASIFEAGDLMSLASLSGVTAWFAGHYHSYVNRSIDGVRYVIAGGAGGRRMPPLQHFFSVQVHVQGSQIDIDPHLLH